MIHIKKFLIGLIVVFLVTGALIFSVAFLPRINFLEFIGWSVVGFFLVISIYFVGCVLEKGWTK